MAALRMNPCGEYRHEQVPAAEGFVARHRSDGCDRRLGSDAPIFADITRATAFSSCTVNATPLDERFECLDAIWRRWREGPACRAVHADRQSGIPELDVNR
jgi:glutathione S-transferase